MKSRFSLDFLESSTESLRAIAHPIRLTVIDLLMSRGKLTVTEIHEHLEIEQAVASHHLRILKDKGVLTAERDGKNTFYALRSEVVGDILHALQLLYQ